ncbi:OmpL47-type beta-barrel domain-containing protein, partial [Haloactinopolyspora alba]
MIERLQATRSGRRSRTARGMVVALLATALAMLGMAPVSTAVPIGGADTDRTGTTAAAQQVLTWTAGDSVTEYTSVTTEATAGPATIVFDNNASSMTHTLTFVTNDPNYNQDVDLNIIASPFDDNGGRHEVEVTLSPGQYKFFCDIPGHGQMTGVLTVTEGSGEDTTPPTVSADVSGEQDADGNYVGSATVAVSADDAGGSGVASVEYEIDDTGFVEYTEPVTVSDPGDHAVQFRATDNAGNVSQTGSVPFTVVADTPEDTTPPTVSAEVSGDQDADGNYVGAATVAVSADDAGGSGVASVEYALDGGAFQAYSEPVTVEAVGSHTVQYRATDNSGNVSQAGSVSFTVVEPQPEDTTPPEVSAEITGEQDADGNYVGSASVTVAAQDAGSGVASVEYDLDGSGFTEYTGPVTVEAVGSHTVQYRATDNSGNVSAVSSVSFTVVEPEPEDTTPPEVSAEVAGDQDADGNYVGSASVTVAAQDPGSGVASVEYDLDGSGFTEYTGPVTVEAVGSHTVQFRATDNSGNVSAVSSVSFTVVEPEPEDTTPPEVSAEVAGEQDADGNYVSSATVTVTAQDPGSGVESVSYALDGGSFGPYGEPVVVDGVGEHTVQFRATDNSGNVSQAGSVSFTVVEPEPEDTTPPTVSAEVTGDQDADGNYVGAATVTVTADDPGSGVDTVSYALDGGSFGPYSEPVVIEEPGSHTVDYRATDNSGNMSDVVSVSFTVVEPEPEDTTPPEVSAEVAGDQDADGNYVGSASVTVAAQDAGSGVASVEYDLDGSGFTEYSGAVEVTETGEHTVRYRATDNSGNTSEVSSVSFTVVEPQPEDTTPPEVSAEVAGEQDADGNYVSSATVTITAQDPGSGVESVSYALDGGSFGPYGEPVVVDDVGEHTVQFRATDNSGNTSEVSSVSFAVVEPGTDACPDSDTRDNVWIGDTDTTVANADTGDGCTINDLIEDKAYWPDHGSFVRHVTDIAEGLENDGVINGREKGKLTRVAARSHIGKKNDPGYEAIFDGTAESLQGWSQ